VFRFHSVIHPRTHLLTHSLNVCRFQGLPAPVKVDHYRGKAGQWSTTQEDFINNLNEFGVYDPSKVIVTRGFFNETLSVSAVQAIAFLRLDGDLYESTRDALVYLYDRVVVGGYVYIDDYGSFVGCRIAVSEFLTSRNLTVVMHSVDELDYESTRGFAVKEGEAVWWRKTK
jgi:hypothetical protein